MSYKLSTSGSFSKTERYLRKLSTFDARALLETYGQQGVIALQNATPVDSGETSRSWSYKVEGENGSYSLKWYNSHINNGENIAILLQYGHGTGTGGYVSGRDYINPACRPIFDQIAENVRKAVSS